MKLDPRLRNLFSFGLMGSGALAVMSGVVNIISAYQLIDAADAESLGVSRNEVVVTYGAILLVGAGMIVFGRRMRKSPSSTGR